MGGTDVEIFGSTFTVKGDAGPEYVQEIARLVDEKMRQIARKSPATSAHRIAVLAALNLADELMKLKERQKGLDELIISKTSDLFELLGEK